MAFNQIYPETENGFVWQQKNSVLNNKTAELHFKCIKTGAWRCDETNLTTGKCDTTYSLPYREDYNISSETKLKQKL